MTERLIDAMCGYHRRWTVENRMWRDAILCRQGCRTVTRVVLLPHLDQARQLAIHEAGHAVVFLALGDQIRYATLNANANDPSLSPGGVQTFSDQRDARGILAGPAAVAFWAAPTSNADIVDIANGARDDFRNVWKAGISVESVADLLRGADRLVAYYWASVERVADALLAAGRLSGDEIAAIAGITCNA